MIERIKQRRNIRLYVIVKEPTVRKYYEKVYLSHRDEINPYSNRNHDGNDS